MVGFWGFRLAVYLLFSRVIGHPEEGRYVQLRKEWKRHLGLRFLFFFEFQALLDVILSTPFLIAALNPHAPLGFLEKFGAGIWLVSMIGEGIADRQLYYFKKNPENASKTCREGLWKYSRHPNYFFDWMTWVGYAVFALGSPWGWIGLISPALVLYFLLDVTGIPATGSASTSQPRRRVPRISAHDEFVRPLVPEKKRREVIALAAFVIFRLSTVDCRLPQRMSRISS